MSKRKPLKSATQRVRSLINEARICCDRPNSQPTITRKMMTFKRYLDQIEDDQQVRRHLLALGLGVEVRALLKNTSDEDGGTIFHGCTEQQIEMWPKHLQPLIRDIDRARVFIPSLGDFVALEPETLSKEQISEAGAYLVGKGQDCIRVGNQLIKLSQAV